MWWREPCARGKSLMSPAEVALLLELLEVFRAEVRQQLSRILHLNPVVVLRSVYHNETWDLLRHLACRSKRLGIPWGKIGLGSQKAKA
jgi:hypothetical protein